MILICVRAVRLLSLTAGQGGSSASALGTAPHIITDQDAALPASRTVAGSCRVAALRDAGRPVLTGRPTFEECRMAS